jgi:single-strand DNA-binding protein
MANFNKVILAGNLTRDPDLRFTAKGMAIAKFGLAVNRRWTSETGEKRDEATFVDIEAFGRQAETIGQYLRKGSPFLVEGRLKLDTWDDKQTNQKRSRLLVVLESFSFLESKGAVGVANEPPASRVAPAPPASPPPPPAPSPEPEGGAPEEDDVPF